MDGARFSSMMKNTMKRTCRTRRGFDAEKAAGGQRFPGASEELPPGPPARAFRCRTGASLCQNARGRGAADFDLGPTLSVADFQIALDPGSPRESDDKVADVGRLAGLAAHPLLGGAVLLLCRELPNHARTVSGRTLSQQALRSPGVSKCISPLTANRRWSGLNDIRALPVSAASNSLRTRISPWRYSTLRAACVVDRVGEHRDDELKGHGEHRGSAEHPPHRADAHTVPAHGLCENTAAG